MSNTIRVTVVLENAGDEVAVEAGLMADIRRVEAEGVIDMGDNRPAPLSVPEDLVGQLGLRERMGLWGGRRCAGPLAAWIGGRRTFGDCLVVPAGRPVHVGNTALRLLDLVPEPVTGTLRPGPGIRV